MRATRRASCVCAAVVLLLSSGCALTRWGYPNTSSAAHEVWEIPLGGLLLPAAVPLDLAGSFLFNFLNPINLIFGALGLESGFPFVLGFPVTSTSLTLLNPDCNLNWTAKVPDGMFHSSSDDDDEDDQPKTPGEELQEKWLEQDRERWEEEWERACKAHQEAEAARQAERRNRKSVPRR